MYIYTAGIVIWCGGSTSREIGSSSNGISNIYMYIVHTTSTKCQRTLNNAYA